MITTEVMGSILKLYKPYPQAHTQYMYFGFASTAETLHRINSPTFVLHFHAHTFYPLCPLLTDESWRLKGKGTVGCLTFSFLFMSSFSVEVTQGMGFSLMSIY